VPRGPLRRASGRNRTVDHAEIARAVAPSIRHDARMSENLAILGAYSDAMARGDREAVFEYWSPDFVSHVTERVNPAMVGSDVRGQELEWWTQCREAFPDMVFTVELLIEKDDLIVSNWMVRGTHTGAAFNGVEPTGKPVAINGTAILRMRDGKIVEHWGGPHCQDGVGLTH
jgi:predicted ester cyclase